MKANARATRQSIASGLETAKALELAKRNADTASDQVRITVETTQHQLRPYLYIEKIEPIKLHKDDEFIIVKMRNFGQTPAENVKIKHSIRRCASGAAISEKVALDQANLSRDIPPHHTQTAKLPVNYDDWEGTVESINSGRTILVINLGYSYAGLGKTYFPDRAVIIFDHNGARQPREGDNLKKA